MKFLDKPARKSFSAPKPDAPRLLAYDVLHEVNRNGGYSNLLLPKILSKSQMDERDKGFATELVYGTLRMQGRHDWILAQASDRPWQEVDPALVDVARLGAHQLFEMRVPTHAAVSATDELGRKVSQASGWGGVEAADGIAFTLRMNGFHREADRIQSIFDNKPYMRNEGTIRLTKLMENDPCWKGYKQVGMKDKNGREVPNCVPEGVVNELGGISSIHKLYLAVSENHRKLKADQLAMAKKYNNETDPAKKAKLMDMLKKGTEKLRTVADNLSDVEERYIMSIDKDAELDLNPF